MRLNPNENGTESGFLGTGLQKTMAFPPSIEQRFVAGEAIQDIFGHARDVVLVVIV